MVSVGAHATWIRDDVGGVLSRGLAGPWAAPSRIIAAVERGTGLPGRNDAIHLVARAVEPVGTTGTEHLGAPPVPVALEGIPQPLVMLTHGGPRAADVVVERPVAAAAVPDPITGRSPAALDEQGWARVLDAFKAEAMAALSHGAWALGVEVARGHLWHAALSPLANGGVDARPHLERLCSLVTWLRKQCPRVAVSCALEDVAVGGIHAERGMDFAARLVDAGAGLVIARTGCAHTPMRLRPPAPRFPHEEGPSLAVAAWLRARLSGRAWVAPAGALVSTPVMVAAVERGAADMVVADLPSGVEGAHAGDGGLPLRKDTIAGG